MQTEFFIGDEFTLECIPGHYRVIDKSVEYSNSEPIKTSYKIVHVPPNCTNELHLGWFRSQSTKSWIKNDVIIPYYPSQMGNRDEDI